MQKNSKATKYGFCAANVSLYLAAVFVAMLSALSYSQAEAGPRRYEPAAGSELASSCSQRYGRAKFQSAIATGTGGTNAVKRGFATNSSFGADENLTVGSAKVAPNTYLKIRYPKGSTAPSVKSRPLGGAGFYAKAGLGENDNAACLTYLVKFSEDFDFVRGGKLPGIFGGDNPPSGGVHPKKDQGFTARLMWRENGRGELYLYAPNMKASSKNSGMRLGMGAWKFNRNVWTNIEIEVVLNNPGAPNGEIHVWIDGTPALFVKGVKFRQTRKLSIGGLMFSTFFGGHTKKYAPKTDQIANFADFQMFGRYDPALDKLGVN